MFEVIMIMILSGLVAYFRIKLLNANVELEDLRLKYKFSQDTLDKIVESRQAELEGMSDEMD